MAGTLVWGENDQEKTIVSDEDELDRILDELTRVAIDDDMPMSVELSVSDNTTLMIVLGLEVSQVTFYSFSSSDGREYFVSLGPADDDEWVVFYYRGHYSEVPRKTFIPIHIARAAIREYFQTGARPKEVSWKVTSL